MACLNCYPRTFTPNAVMVILYEEKTAFSYPDITLEIFMKDSLAYRGSILWNTAKFSEYRIWNIVGMFIESFKIL